MNKLKIRDILRFVSSVIFCWLYLPHFFCYYVSEYFTGHKAIIYSDIQRISRQIQISLPDFLMLLYLLHNNRYFRTVFYHRIGPIASLIIGWYRPGDKYFQISTSTKIEKGFLIAHPYATVINAEFIGDNFSCIHCTTLGAKENGRPTIGNNVTLGASVTIIGNIHIGDNVTIGAGSVVVKDIPDNCIAVGNPARVIRFEKKIE